MGASMPSMKMGGSRVASSLKTFLFGDYSRQADFEEMAYRIALDVAKDENTKTLPLNADAIPYVLKCRHCCIGGKHYETK